jgi:hypothetical protein
VGFLCDLAYHVEQIRMNAQSSALADILRKSQEQVGKADPGMLADELRNRLHDIAVHVRSACSLDDADTIISSDLPEVETILRDVFGAGDVVQVNGSAKSRKTFILVQLAVCIACGIPFLDIDVTPGPVVFLNMEIRPAHFQRRLKRMMTALHVTGPLPHKLLVLHGRGRTADAALSDTRAAAKRCRAGTIILDPVYKLSPSGDENAGKDTKAIVATMDALAEDTGAAISYAHHCAKGSPADRKAVDRGAGHSTLARAYDAALSILPHRDEPDAFVVEWTLRNFAPRPTAAIRWQDGCFRMAYDLAPDPETSKTRAVLSGRTQTNTEEVVCKAAELIATAPMKVSAFKAALKKTFRLSDHKVRELLDLVGNMPDISRGREPGFAGSYLIGKTAAIRKACAND